MNQKILATVHKIKATCNYRVTMPQQRWTKKEENKELCVTRKTEISATWTTTKDK